MNTENLVPENEICGEDAGETHDLKMMLEYAKNYIKSFSWAPKVVEAYMGIGIGGVVGVYLLKFAKGIGDSHDKWL